MPAYLIEAIALFRYVAAHAAAFGGLGAALERLIQRDYAGAFQYLLIALAGFGLPIKPPAPPTEPKPGGVA